ncbi:MAG: cob(I)yrinic acid a,c-diamide adenosyltransferase [Nannocystaceae bacterium]
MVFISKVYTKAGDGGKTMLADGVFVRKNHIRVASYGEVDELNAVLGMVRLELSRDGSMGDHPRYRSDIDNILARIQQELFDLGSELATPRAASDGARILIEARHVRGLEKDIDRLNAPLPSLRSFILPGGGPTAAAAHVARTVCRRAERHAVALAEDNLVRPEVIGYLNRLSDFFFVLSRSSATICGHDEVLWTQRGAVASDDNDDHS